ncbi:MAG: hypothetical protein ACK56F_06435, partial [bacterium]
AHDLDGIAGVLGLSEPQRHADDHRQLVGREPLLDEIALLAVPELELEELHIPGQHDARRLPTALEVGQERVLLEHQVPASRGHVEAHPAQALAPEHPAVRKGVRQVGGEAHGGESARRVGLEEIE